MVILIKIGGKLLIKLINYFRWHRHQPHTKRWKCVFEARIGVEVDTSGQSWFRRITEIEIC